MLKNSKKLLAIAMAALFLSTPLASTASASAPEIAPPMKLELRSNHHNPPSGPNRGPSHSVGRNNGHRSPSHSVRHAPGPRYTSHGKGRHVGHRQPPPPPPRHSSHHHHHGSGNDKLIGGLIAGAVIGAVIANNT